MYVYLEILYIHINGGDFHIITERTKWQLLRNQSTVSVSVLYIIMYKKALKLTNLQVKAVQVLKETREAPLYTTW